MRQHHNEPVNTENGVDRRTLLTHGAALVGGAAGVAMLSHSGAASAATAAIDRVVPVEKAATGPTVVVTTLTGAAIQAAINALPATGGVIELVAGTYSIATPIVLRSWCQLIGAGHATVLRIANASNSAGVIRNADTVNGNADVAVRSLKIDGNKAAQSKTGSHNGVELHRCNDFLLDDLEITSCDGMGIYLSGDGNVTRVGRLHNVFSHDNATNGIQVSWAMREITYTSIVCDLNGQTGLVIDHSESIAMGLHCCRNGLDGLLITNVVDDNVVGVNADLNGRTGIRVIGMVNSVGAAWCAHNNGQKQSGNDVHFDGTLRDYGPTNHVTVSGIECGYLTKSTWGDPWGGSGKATEAYGLALDPSVTGNLTLIGVRNTGGKVGTFSIAAAGSTGNVVILDQPVNTPQLRLLRGQLNLGGALVGDAGGNLGFYGAPAVARAVVRGHSADTVEASLVGALAALGLVTDATT